VGLAGILLGLGLLVWLTYRGWSVLLLAPIAALVTAAFASEPLLASWTQSFMGSAAQFVAQFFPLFLLGALFGKLMEDCGAVEAIAAFMTKKLGRCPPSPGSGRWPPRSRPACPGLRMARSVAAPIGRAIWTSSWWRS
jgi:H+/gluconate symporter-like permease